MLIDIDSIELALLVFSLQLERLGTLDEEMSTISELVAPGW